MYTHSKNVYICTLLCSEYVCPACFLYIHSHAQAGRSQVKSVAHESVSIFFVNMSSTQTKSQTYAYSSVQPSNDPFANFNLGSNLANKSESSIKTMLKNDKNTNSTSKNLMWAIAVNDSVSTNIIPLRFGNKTCSFLPNANGTGGIYTVNADLNMAMETRSLPTVWAHLSLLDAFSCVVREAIPCTNKYVEFFRSTLHRAGNFHLFSYLGHFRSEITRKSQNRGPDSRHVRTR